MEFCNFIRKRHHEGNGYFKVQKELCGVTPQCNRVIYKTTSTDLKCEISVKCRHSVCKKISARKDPDSALWTKYKAATDLNLFFSSLSSVDLEICHSEDYNFIIRKTKTLFNTYYAEHPQDQAVVSDALRVLRDLRNNETHFFIDNDKFVNFQVAGALTNVHGCIALKTRHGSHLVEMKRRMNQQVASKGVQLVTISRPTAYGEYAPYTFIEDEKEFEKLVQKM